MFENFFLLFGFHFEVAQTTLPSLVEISPQPQIREEFSQPIVKAQSAIIMDVDSGKILFEKNAYEKKAIASLTKLMSSVVTRENYDLGESVVVSENASKQPPAKVWLLKGETLSVENLLHALLIESANDAAVALAEKMGEEKFVEKMNQKAQSLGLKNTHFTNPVGYDEEGNYSTPYDLAKLASYVLRDEVLRGIVATRKKGIDSQDGFHHELYSTNNLFGSYLDIKGLKTGLTNEAGECLAAVAEGENGERVLALVLDSPNRFQEVKGMLDWALSSHRW